MEYHQLTYSPDDLRRSLTPAALSQIATRAFGPGVQIASARELPGGEYNTTYLVEIIGLESVVLRVAPPPSAQLFWHEEALMRKEHSIRPYLAPIATLLPKTLSVDFTHQIVDRDYLFQSFMPGGPWLERSDAYPPDQDEELWRQFARIARTIHGVQGDQFGYPHPGATVCLMEPHRARLRRACHR